MRHWCWLVFLAAAAAQGATFQVTRTNDSGLGSLRSAVQSANALPGPDTILISSNLSGAIILTSAIPVISGSMTVVGPGAAQLAVERWSNSATKFRLFDIAPGIEVSIGDLTLRGGMVAEGGAIRNFGTLNLTRTIITSNLAENPFGEGGGGILNTGTLRVAFSTITANRSMNSGGGIRNMNPGRVELHDAWIDGNQAVTGGGLANHGGTVVVERTTLSRNRVNDGGGGLLNYFGSTAATNSTFSGNTALSANGGGGAWIRYGDAVFSFCTIHQNTATNGGSGGGINKDVSANVALEHTIVSGNLANRGPNLSGRYTSLGFNLIGLSAATIDGQSASDQDAEASLFPLADYGGYAPTHLPQPGSRAIDRGTTNHSVAIDQRTFPRPSGARYDVGAVEFDARDSDADGMPNDYELAYGFDAADPADAQSDPDSDGIPNRDEARAGTNPLVANEPLGISGIRLEGAEIAITFAAEPGRTYRIEATSDLAASGSWELVREVTAIEDMVEVREPASGTARFFRIVAL